VKRLAWLWAICLAIVACAPTPRAGLGTTTPGPNQPAERPSAPKVMRIAIQREPLGFVPHLNGGSTTSGGGLQMTEITQNYLVLTDARSAYQPALATELPSLETGSWRLNPDGTMETVYRLRPNAKWHDGTRFTADDLAFGWEVISNDGIPSRRDISISAVASVTATDDATVLIQWKRPYADADGLIRGTLDPMPRWILGDALKRGDGDAFTNLPYFTSEWVGLGPFKLATWVPGSHMEFTRFDDYFRGRPKLDGIVLRFITDANAMVANILASEVDILLPPGISTELARTVEERWSGTGNVVVVAQNGRLRFAVHQNRTDSQTQPALLDPAVRRAMYQAVDRQTLVDVLLAGKGPIADSFIPPEEAMRKDVESAIPQYPFDLAVAGRALGDLGWTRGSDGVLRRDGQPLEIIVQAGAAARAEVEQNTTVDGWKQLGVKVEQRIQSAAAQGDDEARAKFPGIEVTANPYTAFFDARVHSRFFPTQANRWQGSNRSSYGNPSVDALSDKLASTIAKPERTQVIRDLLREYMTDLGIMPLYWDPDPMPMLARVKGVPPPTARTQVHTWNVSEWDVE
jgi:peptide/nickel transport system substrate-binding protein